MRHLFLLSLFLLAPLAPLHSAQEPTDFAYIAELRSDAERGDASHPAAPLQDGKRPVSNAATDSRVYEDTLVAFSKTTLPGVALASRSMKGLVGQGYP